MYRIRKERLNTLASGTRRWGAAWEQGCGLGLDGVKRGEGCAVNRSSNLDVRLALARFLSYDHSHVRDLNNATRITRLKHAA